MLLAIVVIALIIGLFFLISAISLTGFVYQGMKKNAGIQKKCLNILIPSGIIWIFFALINTVLITLYLIENGGRIVELFSQIFELLKNSQL